MLFSEEFILAIDENPVGSIVDACNLIRNKLDETSDEEIWSQDLHEILMEGSALIETIIDANGLFTAYSLPELSGNIDQSCSQLLSYINGVKDEFQAHANELKISAYKNRYQTALKTSFAYEFSQGDLDRVQVLVNELRNKISEMTSLDPDHKRRLLKRLEYLQSELHKRVSDLDRFWGMIGDAGVILGKLGNDAKPIVDRVREISEIVWRTQARAEELPSDSPSPLLENEKNT